ncbi:MAG TPA: ATP-binding protein [Casimicrobiaceae bacterium]|nr:ATP-binding protein [Casimicrobiaceae bacterium]
MALLLLGHAATAEQPRNVLVLHSNNRLAPGNIAADAGLRETIAGTADRPVRIFSEFLDQPAFGGEAYERTMTTYLREKYATQPPSAIVAVSDNAFDFLLRHRAELLGPAPIVHVGVSKSHLDSIPKLPADAIGVPIEYDFSGTIEQALRWHPAARRLVIVTGAAERDRGWEARLRREVPLVSGSVPVEFLTGLPTASVLQRLRGLGADSVVFTPGYYEDADGRIFSPRESAALIAGSANAPVYGPLDGFIGIGVVGGRVPSFEGMGQEAGRIVNALLAGAPVSEMHLPKIEPTSLQVDWRQVKRWGIDEAAIPPGTVVRYREPTFWEAYRSAVVMTAAIILLQAALIGALLLERRRRRRAELAVQRQRMELAHASRLAVAGELTASIAHEINQPLGAVQTSADAADLILQSGADRRDDLTRIVARIRRDNLRASEVIRRLRALFAKQEPERVRLDLSAAVGDAVTLLRTEARQRDCTVDLRLASTPAYVLGDHTQIQQVVIILLINAMEAADGLPADRRAIVVSLDRLAHSATITVCDRGRGLAAGHEGKLFDSFFSTKARGMGLGLSIARTIVEAHGGRIWAESGAGEGAVFRVELPAIDSLAAHAVVEGS